MAARRLKELRPGETFTLYLVVRRRELRTRRDGAPYLALEFGDSSGRLPGNIWDDAERIYGELSEGDVVKVQGVVEQYRDAPQVAVKRIRKARPDDPVTPADLLPAAARPPEEMMAELKDLLAQVAHPHLKTLLSAFFDDETFAAQFGIAPAGKLWHHNRLGGLLEHTLGLCRLCNLLVDRYPEVDRDLLLCGAALHDIGKIQEYAYRTYIDYTDRGRLVGHITLGAQWVYEKAREIDGFPDDLLDRLVHLVISHQGDYGTPVKPMTREAFLLHFADEIDSKMDAFRRMAAEQPEGERWKFVRLLDRHLDLGASGDDMEPQEG